MPLSERLFQGTTFSIGAPQFSANFVNAFSRGHENEKKAHIYATSEPQPLPQINKRWCAAGSAASAYSKPKNTTN